MQKGTVKWWDGQKGFGFLTSEAGKEYFCHITDVSGSGTRIPATGDKVQFEIESAVRGPKAVTVQFADGRESR